MISGETAGPSSTRFVRSSADPGALPASDDDIAFAPVTQLSRWIETRKLSSDRLTRIYLNRIARFNPVLRCVITPTRDAALAQARYANGLTSYLPVLSAKATAIDTLRDLAGSRARVQTALAALYKALGEETDAAAAVP